MAARNERLARMAKSTDQGWEAVDTEAHRFALPSLTEEQFFAKVDKSKTTPLLDIILSFLTPGILTDTWNSFPPDYWKYGSGSHTGTFGGENAHLQLLYTYFAVYIFICAEQNTPKENRKVRDPLRKAITKAVEHFRDRLPYHRIPSHSLLIRFWARFFFPSFIWPSICQTFQNLLVQPGRCFANDEKLLHFTGDRAFIRVVPSKPDRVGLWLFELVVILNNGDPFLVYTRLNKADADAGLSIPVNEVVRNWAKVVKFFVETKKCAAPVLVFDSY